MEKIVVTGGAGHIGSHVVELLVENPNNQVTSIDNYFTGKPENHIKGARYLKGETKDIGDLVPEPPDVLYHLGEYARVATSFEDVKKVYQMNIMGSFAIFEYCRENNVKLVYGASSTRFAADGDGRHQNPYSFAKSVNVDLVRNYGKWYDLDYAIAYFYNAFGPRENGSGKYATLIAKFQEAYLRGEPLTVVKPGTQKRNFTYVKDLARGLVMVGQKGYGDGYALNNPNEVSVEEIAKAFGGPITYVEGYPGRAESGDSPTKAREELGWEATVNILDYIKDFVQEHPRAEVGGDRDPDVLEQAV